MKTIGYLLAGFYVVLGIWSIMRKHYEWAIFDALVLILILSLNVFSCPAGTIQGPGYCAAEPSPTQETHAELSPYIVSDEKPSRHPEPAYQRGEVNAVTPPSLAAQDAKEDQERAEAEAQGKKTAGIK
jgi:hypothetical protein